MIKYLVIIFVILAGCTVGAGFKPAPTACNKIVSLAPNITEILFELGLGDKIAGVTSFCKYPKDARNKPLIGGYSDPNYELILNAKPDVVFLLTLHEKQKEHLKSLNIRSVMLKADSVSDIFDSISKIGSVCNVQPRADELVNSMKDRLFKIKELVKNKNHPRVLVSVGKNAGTDSVNNVFAAGKNTFFNEVIELAGGKNVLQNKDVMYPRLSAEGLIAVNPQVILDLIVRDLAVKDLAVKGENIVESDELKKWKSLNMIDAVKNNRVYILSQDYVTIPGPRVVLLVEQVAKLLHMELVKKKLFNM